MMINDHDIISRYIMIMSSINPKLSQMKMTGSQDGEANLVFKILSSGSMLNLKNLYLNLIIKPFWAKQPFYVLLEERRGS